MINENPCIAVKEITEQIAKWSDEFMADCRSHQRNPQIPKKMDKIQNKMIKFLRSKVDFNKSKKKIIHILSLGRVLGRN